jgi:outer membrane murein-binding lipoprotein Lpp
MDFGTSTARPQHLRALSRANQVRLARAALKKRILRGELSARDVILESPWEASSMSARDLLMSQSGWGLTRARRVLAEVPLSETKTVGSLTQRQRAALAALLVPARRGGTPKPADARGARSAPAWGELVSTAQHLEDLSSEVRELAARRDQLIRDLSRAGATRRSVAAAAALTVARVQQIVAAPTVTSDDDSDEDRQLKEGEAGPRRSRSRSPGEPRLSPVRRAALDA